MIIKKLNAVFHRHSRWLFGAFTIIIIVSFLGFLTPGTFGLESTSGGSKVGTAYGKAVTYNDLRNTSQKTAIYVELFYGMQMRNLSSAELFNQYCLVEKAKNMGITASNKEVADLIRKTPAFQTNGKFDAAKRQNLLKTLRANGITEDVINESFKDQVIMNKFQKELQSGITVSDNEIETMYRQLNAVNVVKSVKFNIVEPKAADIKENDVKEYFSKNRAKYMIPGTVGALIVEFPYSSYTKAAQNMAKDEKLLKQFFLNTIADYATEKNPEPKFADVKAQVAKKFVEEQSKYLARKAGQEFASSVYEECDGKDEDTQKKCFVKKAADSKLKVISAPSVKFDSQTIGKIKNAELVRQLSAGSSLVTNAVSGDKSAYVAIASNRKAPRQAEYKEVAAQVKKDYARAEGVKTAIAKAQNAVNKLKAINNAAKCEAELAKFGKVTETSYSMINIPETPDAYMILSITSGLKVGKVADKPLTMPDGAIVAMLVKRIPADMKKFDGKQKQAMDALCRNRKMQYAILAVQEDISRNCIFNAPNEQ